MANSLQLCVLFISSFVTVKSGIFTGKAFICRDPDTGKLHAVNSTWQSTTFCGNYTCKLKPKNSNTTQFEPSTKAEITNITLSQENTDNTSLINITETGTVENNTILNEASNKERSSNVSEKKINDTKTGDDKKTMDNHRNMYNEKKLDDKDRYLTESEIKSISGILHTVKKSDLDAIVEVYNLAQDIYKEMDSEPTKKSIDENINYEQDELKNNSHKHVSYWYEPLHNVNNKAKSVDMQVAGTNIVNTVKSKDANPNSYFRGHFSGTDVSKVPYYYPISSFQRMASYIPIQQDNKAKTVKASCKNHSTEINQINLNNIKVPGYIFKNPYTGEQLQKVIQPSIFLPYPFSYIPHHNSSSYPYNLNIGNYPWINSGMNKNSDLKTKYNNAALSQSKPLVEESATSLLQDNLLEAMAARKADKNPEWRTEPLATQILDEVKANIESKSKIKSIIKGLPFRKKVKLEKVGKVFKLDESSRPKRTVARSNEEPQDSGEAELFEVFLEKTICQSDTQPGFFKVGNLSQPYPKCCPQRIKPSH